MLHTTTCWSGFKTQAAASTLADEGLDPPSRYGVSCHELAHILLGHPGADRDHWWPGRSTLSLATVEIEAEAAACIVSTGFGLSGASADIGSKGAPGQLR